MSSRKCVLFFIFLMGVLFFMRRKVWPHAVPCLPFTWYRCISLNDGSIRTPSPLRRCHTGAGAELLGYFPNSSRFLVKYYRPGAVSFPLFLRRLSSASWSQTTAWSSSLRTIHVCGGTPFPSVYVSTVAAWELFLPVVRCCSDLTRQDFSLGESLAACFWMHEQRDSVLVQK